MKLFLFSPQSTKASELNKMPGDNALFTLAGIFKENGWDVIGTEVAFLPNERSIPLDRRSKALAFHSAADLTLIMGSSTVKEIKPWFPISECLKMAQPYFYMMEPGRINLELLPEMEEFITPEEAQIFGYSKEENKIG